MLTRRDYNKLTSYDYHRLLQLVDGSKVKPDKVTLKAYYVINSNTVTRELRARLGYGIEHKNFTLITHINNVITNTNWREQ